MKRSLALILALFMLGAALVGCGNTPDQSNDNNSTDNTETPEPMSFKAGFGRQLIDLPLPFKLSGDHNDRPATGFYDKLYASCVAVRDTKGSTVLLIGVDAVFLLKETCTSIREDISAATGISVENIIINQSHSHFTPQFRESAEVENYKALHKACLDAAKISIHDLAPATVYTGVIETEGLTFTRRFIDKNKNGRYEPQTNNEIENPVDQNVYVINFDREGKKDIVLANFAAHSTVSSGTNREASSSYFGPCREEFEKKLNKDAYLTLFQGAAGNSIPKAWVETSGSGTRGDGLIFDPKFIGSDSYGKKLAKYISKCLENNMTEQVSEKGVKVSAKELSIVVDKSRPDQRPQAGEIWNEWHINGVKGNTKRYNELCEKYNMPGGTYEAYKIIVCHKMPGYTKMEINAISIGDIGIASAGYEMLSVTGDEIHEGSPFDFTFVLGYTNAMDGYIPQEAAFEVGGYEVYSCRYVKGTAEKIRDQALNQLNNLYEGK